MGEHSGGRPPDPFNLYNVIHRGEMPSVDDPVKKNSKVLKHAYFTHPSDVEKYFVIGGDEVKKLDVFDIEDGLELICKEGFNKVTRLASGDVLVQTKNAAQIEKLKSTTSFGRNKYSVAISENGVLNQSHAIIRCRDIMGVKIEKITERLQKYNVVSVERLKRKIDNIWVDTATHVLTFNSPIIPAEIKVGFIHVKTEIYIPSPFRCTICLKLGHTKKRCDSKRNKPTCICGQDIHGYGPCLPTRCVNCGAGHPSNSNKCPKYLEEKAINTIRVTLRIPYKLAREEYNKRNRTSTINHPSSSHSYPDFSKIKFSEVVQGPSKTVINFEKRGETVSNAKTGGAVRKADKSNNVTQSLRPTFSKITQKELKRKIKKIKEDEALNNSMIESFTGDNPIISKTIVPEAKQNQLEKYYPAQENFYPKSTLTNQFLNAANTSGPPSYSSSSQFFPNPHPPLEPEPPDIEISSMSGDEEISNH